MKKCCELLAPAGSMESVYAAVQSGADAIYIGGSMFSARASAGNFTNEEIKKVVEYCHLRGVKVHVALNTLIKQDEFNDAFEFAVYLYNTGVDALIVQDLGLATVIKKNIADFELHASTQMTVHNVKDAEMLKKIGFSRVVVARELSFDEIKRIKECTCMEVEMFVHGAICQSYSGQCLFSSLLGGRSGNRGRCAQPCRLEYELLADNKELKKRGYLLSPKDMCLVKHLNEIQSAGIDSLKIEGRLKRGEYVASVVSVYRKYLDLETSFSDDDYKKLLNAFNRSGFTDGYFTGKTGSEMMSYKTPSNIAKEKFDKSVEKFLTENANFRKVNINVRFFMKKDSRLHIEVTDCDGNCVTVRGGMCQEAKTKAADAEFVKKQISRLGNTVFELSEFEADIDEGLGAGASELNELRREFCNLLEKKRTENDRNLQSSFKIKNTKAKYSDSLKLTVQVQNMLQAQVALKYGIERIYIPEHVYKDINKPNEAYYIKCDDISQNPICDEKKLLSGHISSGAGGALGDFRLNVYNSLCMNAYKEIGFSGVCISPELNINEIKKMGNLKDCEVIIYGKLPIMIMKNCVIKAFYGKCQYNSKKQYCLKDRKNERFKLVCNEKNSCTNTLLNSKPIYMADKISDIKDTGVGFGRLIFWDESIKECEKIIKAYIESLKGNNFEVPECGQMNKFTRGHFYRGVL